MGIVKLITEFSMKENAPVEVSEVVDFLRAHGIKDEIEFYDADIDPTILRGEIEHWVIRGVDGAPDRRCAKIYTAKQLEPAEKRLVQCKELLHVIEPDHFHVNTFEATLALIDKIAVSPALQDPEGDGVHANSDRVAILHAMAVLFPSATRDAFMAPYREGKVSLEFIATTVDLPIVYVAAMMSDSWGKVLGRLIRPSRMAGPDRVSTLNNDNRAIEVHSVPVNQDAYSYARQLLERPQMLRGTVAAILIESKGKRETLTTAEIMSLRARN